MAQKQKAQRKMAQKNAAQEVESFQTQDQQLAEQCGPNQAAGYDRQAQHQQHYFPQNQADHLTVSHPSAKE